MGSMTGIPGTIGAYSIDTKRMQTMGDQWSRFERQTSVIPFVAIAQGRNRLEVGEIGWWRILLAIAAFAATMHFHVDLFGVKPFAGLEVSSTA